MIENPEGIQFSGRTQELKRLKELTSRPGFSLLNGRHGLGRTALLQQLAAHYAGNRQFRFFYADVSDAMNAAGFILSIAKQTLGVSEAGQVKQLRELSNYFTYLRPVINFNRSSGVQQMDFTLDENFKAAFTLEQLFTFLARQAPKVIIVLDDLQEVRHYRDAQFLSFLPEVMKQHSELRVLGSVAVSRSFTKWLDESQLTLFKNAPSLTISSPEHDEFRQALTGWFKEQGKKVTADIADQLIEWSRGNVNLLMKVSTLLSRSEFKQPDAWQLEKIFITYLTAQKEIYHTYRRLLTGNQWLLLRGIANERGAKLVMGGEFVKKYGLGSPSSVQTALDALYDKELIYEEDGRLFLQDVALSRWMELQ